MDSAALGVDRALRVASLIWGAVWLLSIASNLSAHPHVTRYAGLSWALIALDACAWMLLAVRRIPSGAFALTLGSCAALQFIVVEPSGVASGNLFLTAVANSAAILTGFALPRARARLVTGMLVLVITLALVVALGLAGLLDELWRNVIVIGFYALADGMAVAFAISVMREAARVLDAERDASALWWTMQSARVAATATAARVAGILHDTVVNTLGAIRRGIDADATARVRDRCRLDLERIEAFLSGARSSDSGDAAAVSRIVEAAQQAARVLALELVCSVDTSNATLPDEMVGEVEDAVSELLLNVSKHCGDPRVDLHIAALDGGSMMRVAVRDHGPGWSEGPTTGGFARSVVARVSAMGGSVAVDRAPTGGTVVALTVPLGRSDVSDAGLLAPPTAPLAMSLRTVVLVSGGWMAALGAVQTALVWAQPQFLTSSLALVLVVAALVIVRVSTSQTSELPRWALWLAAPVLAAVVALPQVGIRGCSVTDLSAWGPDGAAALILLMVLLGRGWLPAVLAVSGLAAGLSVPLLSGETSLSACSAPLASTLLIEVGTVGVVHLLRTQVLAMVVASEESWRQRAEALAAETAARTKRNVVAARLVPAVEHARGLVTEIASGAVDPCLQQVRDVAGRHERTLRSLLAITANPGPLGDILAEFTVSAAETGRLVRVNNVEPVRDPAPEQLTAIRGALMQLPVQMSERGLALTMFDGADGASLWLVAEEASGILSADSARSCEAVGVVATCQDFPGQSLLTFTWRTP